MILTSRRARGVGPRPGDFKLRHYPTGAWVEAGVFVFDVNQMDHEF